MCIDVDSIMMLFKELCSCPFSLSVAKNADFARCFTASLAHLNFTNLYPLVVVTIFRAEE